MVDRGERGMDGEGEREGGELGERGGRGGGIERGGGGDKGKGWDREEGRGGHGRARDYKSCNHHTTDIPHAGSETS